MQDGAPGHSATSTLQELQERGIRPIFWPAFSPDLNPIETVWNKMKDWIQENYPAKLNHNQLRGELIDSMPARCEAVIRANGMHTLY